MGSLTHKKLEDLSHDELFVYARDLQLRVGKFLSVEQQLINVRDMLDNEVVIHKRMNSFNEQAFKVSDRSDFFQFIAESVVDIFEFEFGISIQYDAKNFTIGEVSSEGIHIEKGDRPGLLDLFKGKFEGKAKRNALKFNHGEWPALYDVIPFHQFILVNLIDEDSSTGIFVAGGVLEKSARNYQLIEKQRNNAFELFAKEVLSHYINNQKTQRISGSMNRLSSLAETFLGFGSDPLDNIKTITRKACQILMADLAFYKPTSRNKPIYHFNHDDTDLKFSDTERVFLSDEVLNSPEETTIYSNWPDTYINHLREHHANVDQYGTVCRKIRLDDQLIGVFGICFPENKMPGLEEMQIIGIIAAAIAVEEKRYLSGMELKESEEKYRVVFEGTPHGSMIIQLPEGSIKYVNPSMCKMFDFEEAIFKIKTLNELHRDADVEKLMLEMHQAKGKGGFQARELVCMKNDGTEFFADVNALPVTLAGNDFIALFYVDITERKLAQQRLLENNRELTKINSELDNFVYSVSHDLRTPLLAIKGLVDLVDLHKGDSDENVEFIDLIEGSVDRMDETIKEILDYSRNARTEVNKRRIDLKKIIQEAYADMRFFSKHQVLLEMNIADDLHFISDESRINTIIRNLMGNAIKYADDSKSDSFVKISARNDHQFVILEIEDNGEGISESSITSVFDMFYRASNKTTGTGLGLYITKEMINKIGGEISIESTVKIGTSIKIVLPD